VASKRGFTHPYTGLQQHYRGFKDRGFLVLGFPANNFLRQEPIANEEIKSFCRLKNKVTFPIFGKMSVAGRDIYTCFAFLTSKDRNPNFGGRIKWNFSMFLVDREGVAIGRFNPADDPPGEKVALEVESALSG
jgi:glutathione peroxidase